MRPGPDQPRPLRPRCRRPAPEAASVLRTPGEFSTGDLQVRGVRDLHSGASRLRDFPNVMFRLETSDVSFLHIGDNRSDWPAEVARDVGKVDVLMVTVDDSIHLLTYDEVDSLVQRLEPRVVIPMHYFIPGISASDNDLLPPERMAGAPADGAPPGLPRGRPDRSQAARKHRGLAVQPCSGIVFCARDCAAVAAAPAPIPPDESRE